MSMYTESRRAGDRRRNFLLLGILILNAGILASLIVLIAMVTSEKGM